MNFGQWWNTFERVVDRNGATLNRMTIDRENLYLHIEFTNSVEWWSIDWATLDGKYSLSLMDLIEQEVAAFCEEMRRST